MLKDSDADLIVNQLEELLAAATSRYKVNDVLTFSDTASIEVIEFGSLVARRGFFRTVENIKQTSAGKKLWFSSNKTFMERACDKALGMIKHHLIDSMGYESKDIKIQWKKNNVKVGDKEAAWVSATCVVTMQEELSDVQEMVDASMNEWFSKRGGRDRE